MELSSSNIKKNFRIWNFVALILKKFLYFLKRKLFLYFRKWNPALFTTSLKNKRNPPREESLYFRKQKTRKKSCIFSKENCSYISVNGYSKKTSYISGGNLQSQKIKKFFMPLLIKKQSFLNENTSL